MKGRPLKQDQIGSIVRLLKTDLPMSTIAIRIGVRPETIQSVNRRYKVRPKGYDARQADSDY